MEGDALMFTFPETSTAAGNQFASSLAKALRDTDPGIVVSRERERPDTQDFGASLAVVLGSAAVSAVGRVRYTAGRVTTSP